VLERVWAHHTLTHSTPHTPYSQRRVSLFLPFALVFFALFGGARTALLHTVLCIELGVSDEFHERRLHRRIAVNLRERRHSGQSGGHALLAAAFAALLFVLHVASGFAALQLALGTRAGGGFGARPRARRLFAERSAVRFRGDTSGVALCRRANGLAFRARVFLAHVLGTTHRTLRLFAVDRAFGALRLLALHLALRACAHGVAHRRARRVIALPTTSRVAILLSLFAVGFDLDL